MKYCIKWRSAACDHEAYTANEKTAMGLYVLLSKQGCNVTLWHDGRCIAGVPSIPGVSPQPNTKGRSE